jgi:hypothetical protein
LPLLRASARRTQDIGFTGWPTPEAGGFGGATNIDATMKRRAKYQEKYGNNGFGLTTSQTAAFAAWPTPTVGNATGSQMGKDASATGRRPDGSKATVSLAAVSRLAGWVSPTAEDGRRGGLPPRPHDRGVPLSQQVSLAESTLAIWATPSARDWRSDRSRMTSEDLYGSKGQPLARQSLYADSGEAPTGSGTATASTGLLSPEHSRWLMGIPAEWSSCAPTATRSASRRRPRSSALRWLA